MKLSKSVQTLYIPKEELQTKHTVLYSGEVRVKTGVLGKPRKIRRPRGFKGRWINDSGVWVEFKAVRTFKVK